MRDTYIFHENWNLPALLSRLVRAVRTGDDRSVFMYLAIMSHTIVDPAACNHDPIVSAGETVMRRILGGACKDRKGLRR